MALPIQPTPILRGRDARKFNKKLKRGLENPTKLIDTPRLAQARKLAREHAAKKQK
jgi:hypothetical protein